MKENNEFRPGDLVYVYQHINALKPNLKTREITEHNQVIKNNEFFMHDNGLVARLFPLETKGLVIDVCFVESENLPKGKVASKEIILLVDGEVWSFVPPSLKILISLTI